MVAATNNIRAVSIAKPKSPRQAPIPLSIAPRGNRSLMPTVKRASRITAKPGTRDYGKQDDVPTPFDIPGFSDGG